MSQTAESDEFQSNFVKFFLLYRIFKTNVLVIIAICFAVGFLLIGLSVHVIHVTRSLVNIKIQINSGCLKNVCTFVFHLEKDYETPLHFFVGFEDLAINNQRVINSYDPQQLSGQSSASMPPASSCGIYTTLGQGRRFYPGLQTGAKDSDPLFPCGLYPLMYEECSLKRQTFPMQS